MTAVLFTCAGQRVDIVTEFKRAGARTIAADVNRLAPALYHADAHAFVPPVEHEQTYYAHQTARQDPKAGERSLH